jgi:hypothetical protein
MITAISIFLLSAGLVVTSLHLSWMNRNILRLSERIHHLEMERDYPGWIEREALKEALRWREENPPDQTPG